MIVPLMMRVVSAIVMVKGAFVTVAVGAGGMDLDLQGRMADSEPLLQFVLRLRKEMIARMPAGHDEMRR